MNGEVSVDNLEVTPKTATCIIRLSSTRWRQFVDCPIHISNHFIDPVTILGQMCKTCFPEDVAPSLTTSVPFCDDFGLFADVDRVKTT